jgi:hypothetical protein
MKGRQYAMFAAVSAALLGSATISSGAPANPISACPFTISSAGTYTLVNDLTAAGDCITVDPSAGASVTVNLNGFSITGDTTGAAIIAVSPALKKKVSVVGPGKISAFDVGVNISLFPDVTVKRLTIDNTGIGISVGQGSVYDSTITGSGFGVYTGGKSLVRNITATGNLTGIFVGPGSTVDQSTANSNAQGILADDKSLVKNSTANGNTANGIVVGMSGSVTQCTANNNGSAGITGNTKSDINSSTAMTNFDGIVVNCPATVQQNTATGNTDQDIVLNGSGCTVKKNVVTGP